MSSNLVTLIPPSVKRQQSSCPTSSLIPRLGPGNEANIDVACNLPALNHQLILENQEVVGVWYPSPMIVHVIDDPQWPHPIPQSGYGKWGVGSETAYLHVAISYMRAPIKKLHTHTSITGMSNLRDTGYINVCMGHSISE